jgi:hypothetical protein
MRYRITVANGHGSLRHNNREFVAANVDRDRIKENVTLERMSLKKAYSIAYGKAIDEYNTKQKRADRKLTVDKYMAKIEAGQGKKNNPKLFYESIFQIGDIDTAGNKKQPKTAEQMKEILACYFEDFKKRTEGHILIVNAVIHMDEATPHMHVDWIPLGKGYKKGMSIRNSLEKAVGQMGIRLPDGVKANKKVNNRAMWQESERNQLAKICKEHGIEAYWEKHNTPEPHLDISDYKKIARMQKRENDKKYDELLDKAKASLKELTGTGIRANINKLMHGVELVNNAITLTEEAKAIADKSIGDERRELQLSFSAEKDRQIAEAERLNKQKDDQERQAEELAEKEKELKQQQELNQHTLELTQQLKDAAEQAEKKEKKHKEEAQTAEKSAESAKAEAQEKEEQLRKDREEWEKSKSKWLPIETANLRYVIAKKDLDTALKQNEQYIEQNEQLKNALNTTQEKARKVEWYQSRYNTIQKESNNVRSDLNDAKSYGAAVTAERNALLEIVQSFAADGRLTQQQQATIQVYSKATQQHAHTQIAITIALNANVDHSVEISELVNTMSKNAKDQTRTQAKNTQKKTVKGIHRSQSHSKGLER